ncbi:hypothetical protein ACFCYB_00165 [Streptomyces sp. NPDC056309]|uniref:hypothetical protein n=1 Tax=Streptomyces sp. NPDC056309 TaxID=3345781 RepID=UPI0035D71B25
MDFRTALNGLLGQLTPQPWEYTAPGGGTLTVIPAGLREDPGQAEVYVRITFSKTQAAQCAVTTTDLPNLIATLSEPVTSEWELVAHWADGTPKPDLLDGGIALEPVFGGFTITVTSENGGSTATATMGLPEQQRMPLASALRRAMDVARDWES